MARRRGFGEVERRKSARGEVTYRARYAMPDGTRYSRTLSTAMDAEAWLVAERTLVDRDEWTPPRARIAAEEKRKAVRHLEKRLRKAQGKRYKRDRQAADEEEDAILEVGIAFEELVEEGERDVAMLVDIGIEMVRMSLRREPDK